MEISVAYQLLWMENWREKFASKVLDDIFEIKLRSRIIVYKNASNMIDNSDLSQIMQISTRMAWHIFVVDFYFVV